MSSGSYFLDDRNQPLMNPTPTTLNEYFQTEHLDIREDDYSICASVVRSMAMFVGHILTPKQALAILRVLKAITLCFVVLTFLSNIMYILFVEFHAGQEVREVTGGWRDVALRFFALILLFLALAIEIDYRKIVKKYYGLKAFIPRSILYLIIALVTASHPDARLIAFKQQEEAQVGDDDAQNGDDAEGYDNSNASLEIPVSAVGFQRVTSFILGCCGLAYFVCGLLCLDRFTARAFLSDKDPCVTTAIATPSSIGPSSPSQRTESVANDVEQQQQEDENSWTSVEG